MKAWTLKLTVMLMAGFFLVYAAIQLYRYYNIPLRTQTAVNYAVADVISVTGVAVRDEEPLEASPDGVVSYLYNDGTKVSSGTEVALIYSDPDDAHAQMRVREIDAEIRSLEDAKAEGTSYFSHTDVVSRQISQHVGNFIDALEQGEAYACLAIKREITAGMNKKQIATNTQKDFSARISMLGQEKNTLQSSIDSINATVKAQRSGYFVKGLDGLEAELTPAMLRDITPQGAADMISLSRSPGYQGGAIGRIVKDFRWSFVANVPNETAQRFAQGGTVEVDFGLQDTGPINAIVEKVEPGDLGSDGMIILSCTRISEQLLSMRVREAKIKLRMLDGLMVSTKALRFVDGQKGVYVRRGYTVVYRPIRTVYEETGFVLCDPSYNDGGTVRLFDEVIIEGTDLYDGKLIE